MIINIVRDFFGVQTFRTGAILWVDTSVISRLKNSSTSAMECVHMTGWVIIETLVINIAIVLVWVIVDAVTAAVDVDFKTVSYKWKLFFNLKTQSFDNEILEKLDAKIIKKYLKL